MTTMCLNLCLVSSYIFSHLPFPKTPHIIYYFAHDITFKNEIHDLKKKLEMTFEKAGQNCLPKSFVYS
jgi:hypothetical protein